MEPTGTVILRSEKLAYPRKWMYGEDNMAATPLPKDFIPPEPKPENTRATVLSETTVERLKKTHTDELVFALCGPIGSPLHLVADELREVLEEKFNYECQTLSLSGFIKEFGAELPPGCGEFRRIKHLISEGDKLRQKYGNGVLVELGISKIFQKRVEAKEQAKSDRFMPRRYCHIFDSIKNQQELDVLRTIYGDLLYCIGVFSPITHRVAELKKQGMRESEIYDLFDQDSGEEIEHGQTVRDTFPQADFFLKVDSLVADQIEAKVSRLLNLITHVGIETPTVHETAMFMAASAAGSSACLSRQVGASVSDKDGRVLGVGWNDVPKFGGGLYGDAEARGQSDYRCMKKGGICYNDDQKNKIARETMAEMVKAGIVKKEMETEAAAAMLKSKVKDLIEFSRSVHAEVLAIVHAAQESGLHMRGGRLYCTTYPCHACARLIIVSGIAEVYFIEPYRKSLATALHDDAISEDPEAKNKVRLLPYEGVAPRRYQRTFEMKSPRKLEGKLIVNRPSGAHAASGMSLESFPVMEAFVVAELEKGGLISRTDADHEEKA